MPEPRRLIYALADTITKLVITKSFTYRDLTDELFSNVYEFNGPVPSSFQEWHDLTILIWSAEKRVFTNTVKLVHAVGHDNNDPHAQNVYIEDLTPLGDSGSYINVAGIPAAGDQAACVEFKTNINSTKGKPVYLRKFFHDCHIDPADRDRLDPPYLAELATYAGNVMGSHDGLACWTPGQPKRLAVSHKTIPWVTTRTLRKRGKKKKPT